MNKFLKIIAVLAVAGVISLAFQIGLTRKYADWQPADGRITDIRIHRSTGGRHGSGGTHEIHYEYTVDGMVYSGVNAYSGEETERFAGEKVTIWHDPRDHQAASFHPPGPGLYPIVSFIFAFPLVMRIVFRKNPTQKGRKSHGKDTNSR